MGLHVSLIQFSLFPSLHKGVFPLKRETNNTQPGPCSSIKPPSTIKLARVRLSADEFAVMNSGITTVSCSSSPLPLRHSPLTHGASPPAIR